MGVIDWWIDVLGDGLHVNILKFLISGVLPVCMLLCM